MNYNNLTQRKLMNEEFFAIEDQHQLERRKTDEVSQIKP
jgi:hypothetical protein